MKVCLYIRLVADYASQGPHQVVNGTRRSTSDSIGDANSIDTGLIDCFVKAEQVDKVGPEGVLGREADFETLATRMSRDPNV
jgi:hypothetical protein